MPFVLPILQLQPLAPCVLESNVPATSQACYDYACPLATFTTIPSKVKNVLIKDGWTITHDPFPLRYGIRRLYADLGAEKLFAAAKASRKIVVEVKSFSGPSEVTDLQEALGAYGMYRHILADTHPGWELYLAVPQDAYYSVFSEPLGQLSLPAKACVY